MNGDLFDAGGDEWSMWISWVNSFPICETVALTKMIDFARAGVVVAANSSRTSFADCCRCAA